MWDRENQLADRDIKVRKFEINTERRRSSTRREKCVSQKLRGHFEGAILKVHHTPRAYKSWWKLEEKCTYVASINPLAQKCSATLAHRINREREFWQSLPTPTRSANSLAVNMRPFAKLFLTGSRAPGQISLLEIRAKAISVNLGQCPAYRNRLAE
jgi:hypothetical protein